MDNYIGLDAHSKTCTFVIMNKDGELTREGKINTTERNLKELARSVEGSKALMFEETNVAQWIYCVLKDEVDKLIVCHPAHLPKKSGPKNDYRDAFHLVMQLRAGNYTSVYHEQSELMNLRAVINHYSNAAIRLGKLKYAFKAVLRSEGIASESAFKTSRNKLKIEEIKNPAKRLVAQRIFDEMNDLELKKETWVEEFRSNKFNIPVIKLLGSIPGVGPVRAHEIAAYMCTGHRFENKHKLWAYAKLVRHHDESDGYILRRRTPHGRSELKNAFMGAAQRVIISPANTGLKDYYKFLIEK